MFYSQTVGCFSVSDKHGQTSDAMWLSQHGF